MIENNGKILCLGDSNTYGYEPEGFFRARYPANVRWTGLLKNAGWQVINRGVNGACVPTEYEFLRFEELIKEQSPLAAVTVMFGTNDVLNGKSAEKTAESMGAFLEAVKDCLNGAAVLLIAPPPVKFGGWVPEKSIIAESEKLAPLYKAAAEEKGVFFADAGEWDVALTFDGVHFTAGGHGAFFRGLSRSLKAAVE